MDKSRIIPQLFATTTVNTVRLERYLKAMPIYYETGLAEGLCQLTLDLLVEADDFDFAVRRYLLGRPRTLALVFTTIRSFEELGKPIAWQQIACCLDIIEDSLLQLEAYELMPRYQQARKRIERHFQIDLDDCLNEVKQRLQQRQHRELRRP